MRRAPIEQFETISKRWHNLIVAQCFRPIFRQFSRTHFVFSVRYGRLCLQERFFYVTITVQYDSSLTSFTKLYVQGNCTEVGPVRDNFLPLPSNKAPLFDSPLLQCLIVVREEFITPSHNKLWIDSVHFRLNKEEDEHTLLVFGPIVNAVESDVWITRSTFEGDGDGVPDCLYCAVRSRRGSIFMEGTHCTDLALNIYTYSLIMNVPH